jgi:hypothetical protein
MEMEKSKIHQCEVDQCGLLKSKSVRMINLTIVCTSRRFIMRRIGIALFALARKKGPLRERTSFWGHEDETK